MIQLRPADERGAIDAGWLEGRYSFSFGDYHDPAHMGVSDLRVINDDYVAAGQGFPTHGHRDMEIITVVLEGEMAHKDSMGNGSTIRPGDIQVMSAGRGVTHSEYNASASERSHSLQIWLFPNARAIEPQYGQKHFSPDMLANRLQPVVSGDGRDQSLTISQDATLYRCRLDAGAQVVHHVDAPRCLWLQVIAGRVEVGDVELGAGDGARIDDVDTLTIKGVAEADLLLFDLRAA
ncbi:pirin family protein [Salinisphaera aquimarina]|uniref:Pirin family protein n=1 Tax=Salinisphaera aquimarina TaxID=2094031 RepID=A0ABV7ERI6_9GAMM